MLQENEPQTLEMAVRLTMAWLGNPNSRIEPEDLPRFVSAMHATIAGLAGTSGGEGRGEPSAEFAPAVSVEESLASKDYIISMIDGRPYKMLRRHLSRHGLTPEEYRKRYNLPPDYPIVAESYSAKRRKLAKQIGLGLKGRAGRWPAEPKAAKGRAAKPDAKAATKPKEKSPGATTRTRKPKNP